MFEEPGDEDDSAAETVLAPVATTLPEPLVATAHSSSRKFRWTAIGASIIRVITIALGWVYLESPADGDDTVVISTDAALPVGTGEERAESVIDPKLPPDNTASLETNEVALETQPAEQERKRIELQTMAAAQEEQHVKQVELERQKALAKAEENARLEAQRVIEQTHELAELK
jgi:hypothetical protein